MFQDADRTVQQILQLHADTVERWHTSEIDNPHQGLLEVVCKQHQFNFLLWHEEDIARSRSVSEQRIAEVKRAIDGYNQNRNDSIERIDDMLLAELSQAEITASPDAPLNTETPGSAIDRLSIMSLRIYHMNEQLERDDAEAEHLAKVQVKLDLCHEQKKDLSSSLTELLADIGAGRKRLKLYRQMKMYNDPTLNPYLYSASLKKAG